MYGSYLKIEISPNQHLCHPNTRYDPLRNDFFKFSVGSFEPSGGVEEEEEKNGKIQTPRANIIISCGCGGWLGGEYVKWRK